jgi:23S rRNA (cytidine1920-2'-O)/16S rRNA (cytidine1409-2'-O)-methyltransferase
LARTRLDQLLVARGLAASRTRSQALIAAGAVRVGDLIVTRPAASVAEDAAIVIADDPNPWVSRAALKLAHALDHFSLDPAGLVVLDIGASTGGFTQVLLARDAVRVYAVDVGRDQLAPTLRADPRVVMLEKTNARMLTQREIPDPAGAIVCDTSFIGLETVLPAPLGLAAPQAWLVALIKPQFEVGPGGVGSGGIVRDPRLLEAACDRIRAWLAVQPGWRVLGLCESPILGGDGNREFLIAGVRGVW